jgi:MoxR-like ATPase
MCSLRNIEFLVSYWLLSKLLDRTLKLNFSTPVKDESDMELNTKVEDYEILHMLTKL